MTDSASTGRARSGSSPQDATDRPVNARPDRGVYRRLQPALLGTLLVIGAVTSEAQSTVKQLLMLQYADRGNLVLDDFITNFRARVDQRPGKPVNVVQVVVGATGFVGAPGQAVVDYIRSMYADRPPPDLVVTTGGPAAVFARTYRRQLFPRTPLLFASVDRRWFDNAPLGENETAAPVTNEFPSQIDAILRVLPETRQVFMVTGAGPIGHFWRGQLESEFARFRDRVTFVWSDDLSFSEVLRRCASLPPHTAIFFLAFTTDAHGGTYGDEQVLAALHAAANAPIFAAHSPLLGHGIVGGVLMPIGDLGRTAGNVAVRMLNGESPASLRVPPPAPEQWMFDGRELERWDIPESRLPAGSVVMYRRPTLWDEHEDAVLAVVGALVVQSFLIALLLLERRARQRAEIEGRRNLALAADADRRETISALATSIGHELRQPLSAIMHNTQALRKMVAANRAAPDETAEILADISAGAVRATQIVDRHRTMLRSHELQKHTIDLHVVIGESLALVAHDMRARQIEATLDLSSTPCVVDGDPVLLAQVIVNLVRNAMDALAETAPALRRITIRSAVTATDVELSVRDTGTGLPAEIIDNVSRPFITTKSYGLGIGLTIAQRIVEAHAGTLAAHENVDGGATFTLTLPRSLRSSPVAESNISP